MKELLNEYPAVATVVMTTLTLLPLFKLAHYVLASNRTFKIQSLELLCKSISDSSNGASRLIAEQMFRSHFKLLVNFKTIEALLNLPNPTLAIDLYGSSKKYLILDNSILIFKNKYQNPKRRKVERLFRPIVAHILYWVFAMTGAFFGLYVIKNFNIDSIFETKYYMFNGALWFLASLISFAFITLAIAALTDKASIKKAEILQDLFKNKGAHKVKWYY